MAYNTANRITYPTLVNTAFVGRLPSTRHDQRLIITSETAKHAFNDMMNAALPETKQSLQCFRAVLARMGIPFEEKRTKQARMLVIEADALVPIIQKYGYKSENALM